MVQADELNMGWRLFVLVVVREKRTERAGEKARAGGPLTVLQPLVETAVVDREEMGDVLFAVAGLQRQ